MTASDSPAKHDAKDTHVIWIIIAIVASPLLVCSSWQWWQNAGILTTAPQYPNAEFITSDSAAIHTEMEYIVHYYWVDALIRDVRNYYRAFAYPFAFESDVMVYDALWGKLPQDAIEQQTCWYEELRDSCVEIHLFEFGESEPVLLPSIFAIRGEWYDGRLPDPQPTSRHGGTLIAYGYFISRL
ncbi:MAG: hypothetical protein H7175_11245 [Burkholderiales bacterium]|nr:hypothetical protein [Anaerolineae bacterium]